MRARHRQRAGRSRESDNMILCVDVGNTLTNIGFFDQGSLYKVAKFHLTPSSSYDEVGARLSLFMDSWSIGKQDVGGAIVCSVVPSLESIFVRLFEQWGLRPLVVGKKLKTGVRVNVPNPSEVGNDLIADCAGADLSHDAVIADLGTATKLIAYSAKDGFIGVSIMPGLAMAAEALCHMTASLPLVGLECPLDALGRNTADSINSGICFGSIGAIKEIGGRLCAHLHDPKLILTGGYAGKVKDRLREYDYQENLLLNGLYRIYGRNRHE